MTKIQVISCPSLGAPARYGVSQLAKALEAWGFDVEEVDAPHYGDRSMIVIGRLESPIFHRLRSLKGVNVPQRWESFALTPIQAYGKMAIGILGSDDVGMMYGCFEMMEKIGALKDKSDIFHILVPISKSPDMLVRGLYTFLHNSDLEREWFYSEEFWDSYFELLAKSRYNQFNLVFGHQTAHLIPIYPYFFKVEEYPQVYAEGITEEDRRRNLDTLRFISRLAVDRGIKFFIGIWQSKPWPADHPLNPQAGRVNGITDDTLPDFTARGISKLLKLCPDIMGIQLRMNIESGIADQSFFTNVFIPAIGECGRDIELDIRNWGLRAETLEKFIGAHPNSRVSMKYFAEHQGMPYQPVQMRHGYSYDDILRNDRTYNVFWHAWNLGTHRLFVWGDPGYVKWFVRSCHLGDGLGFEVTPPLSQKGFSQYGERPGYWSIYKEGVDHGCYKWEYEKYWFFYKLWGRIGYDPDLGDEVWLRELAERFGEKAAPYLFEAYKESSKVISYIISHHMDDPNMYIWLELDSGGAIDFFSGIIPGERTLFVNGRDYAKGQASGKLSARITPFQAARDLEGFARRCMAALAKVDKFSGLKNNQEYFFTKLDMQALSALARYNAQKISASGYLCLFYETGDYNLLKKAKSCAEAGLRIWKELVGITEPYYDRLHLGPSGGHWKDNLKLAEYDLDRIKAVEEIFKKYGIFRKGFDFGGKLPPRDTSRRWYEREDTEYDPVERRFEGVDDATKYSVERGYGWEDTGGLFVEKMPSVGFRALRGARLIGSDMEEIPDFPREALYTDFVGGRGRRKFVVDLKRGRYLLTFIIGDTSVNPKEHGTMNVYVNGERAVSGLPIPMGEIKEISHSAKVRGKLEVEFESEQGGEWIINGLVVRDYAPAIGHLAPYSVSKEDGLEVIATVTSPSPIDSVRLYCRGNKDKGFRSVAMKKSGPVYSARVPGSSLKGGTALYYIEAKNRDGDVSFFPERGERNPISVNVVRGYRRPCIIEHTPPKVHPEKQGLKLKVRVTNPESLLELRLHYRRVNQNDEFKVVSMKGRGGWYEGVIPGEDTDRLYDMMYYFEAIDALGGGSFYPDPFEGGRYFVVRIVG